MDEGCYELSHYDTKKLSTHQKEKVNTTVSSIEAPSLSRSFISGTLTKPGNQARMFKIILSKYLKEYMHRQSLGE